MSYRGAYGFRMEFPDADGPLTDLAECGSGDPRLVVGWRVVETAADHAEVGARHVSFGTKGGTSIFVDRDPPAVTFHLPDPPIRDAIVHPLGTIAFAILARWRGDVTLHAGGFSHRDGAWAVVGHREAGKSTLLASLAGRGVPIVADDLLTVLDGRVWPGPACVDLRPDVAPRFRGARDLGVVSGRRRFRLSTTPERRRLPLRGILVLDWSDGPGVSVAPLSAEERLRLLYDLEYVALVGPADPRALMDLVTVPAWRIRRSRRWEESEAAVDAVLRLADTATAPA